MNTRNESCKESVKRELKLNKMFDYMTEFLKLNGNYVVYLVSRIRRGKQNVSDRSTSWI